MQINQQLLNSGTLVGQRYEIQETLGAGGMGWVFRARDTRLDGQLVALKFLYPHLVSDDTALARFRNEVLVARKLIHPYIIRTYAFESDAVHAYLVMEYVDGCTLREHLHTSYPNGMPPERVIEIAFDTAVGMQHSHTLGIIHRDLKPDNIMVARTGEIKLSDFGLAALVRRQGQHTHSGQLLGTPYYMAPEQFRGETLDVRADIYAFGILLYELLFGKVPFSDASLYGLAKKHEQCEIALPPEHQHDTPQALWTIVQHATKKQPNERFNSFSEVVQEFEKLCSSPRKITIITTPGGADRPNDALGESDSRQRRNLLSGRMLFFELLVLLIVGVIWIRSNTYTRAHLAGPIMLAESILDTRLTALRSLLAIHIDLDSTSLAEDYEKGYYGVRARLWVRDDLNAKRNLAKWGRSALYIAAKRSDLGGVREFLRYGADPNLTADDGTSTLHMAAENHNVAVAKVLLDAGALPDVVAVNGETPLLSAAHTRDSEMAELLLEAGADPIRRNAEGLNTLMLAAAHGDERLFKAALAKIPRDAAIDSEAILRLAPELERSTFSALLEGFSARRKQ